MRANLNLNCGNNKYVISRYVNIACGKLYETTKLHKCRSTSK